MEDRNKEEGIIGPEKKKKRFFSEEFKKEAVELTDRIGNSQGALDLGEKS